MRFDFGDLHFSFPWHFFLHVFFYASVFTVYCVFCIVYFLGLLDWVDGTKAGKEEVNDMIYVYGFAKYSIFKNGYIPERLVTNCHSDTEGGS